MLVCTVEYRRCNVKTKNLCCKRKVNLKHLSDVHSGRYAERVQHDVKRTTVRKERHILYRKHAGNDTLVTVTTCHLIADLNLSLLRNVDTNGLLNSRRKLIAVFSGKYLSVYDDTVLTVRNTEGGISYFSCLLTKDCTEKSFFCGKLGLTLRGNLTNQNIGSTNLCTYTDNTALVKIL